MVEPLPKQVLDTAVDPAKIAQQSFDPARRGFDQRQVQQYLVAVADSLRDAQQREADMRTRLGRAVRRAEAAESSLRQAPASDEAELTRQFGDEVASVLEAARVASDQRIAQAEQAAAQVLSQAHAEAQELRAAADALMVKRSVDADAAAVEIVGEGHTEAQVLRHESRVAADAMVSAAADRVERARNECDALIAEAEEARAQILEDMERRRRQARAQVERLRVGRDRLLRSYEVVRRTLEETTVELKSSLQEAKVRGDGAARAITSEPLANRDQLEAELRDAKMIGRITISEIAPPASSPSKKAARAAAPRSPALPRQIDAPQSAAARPGVPRPGVPRPGVPKPGVPKPGGTRPGDAAAEAGSSIDGATTSPPTPRRPRVSEAMKRNSVPAQPKAPAVAPTLTPRIATEADEALAKDPIAAMMYAAEARRADTAASVSADLDDSDEPVDQELAELEDDDLNVIEPSDEIETVLAMPATSETDTNGSALGLFAALREQRTNKTAKSQAAKSRTAKSQTAKSQTAKSQSAKSQTAKSPRVKTSAVAPQSKASPQSKAPRKVKKAAKAAANKMSETKSAAVEPQAAAAVVSGIEAQRDAVIADAAKQLEKRLKRALADEQNDLLAGIRAAKRNKVALTTIVGDVDAHVNRYVLAIHEVAAITYGAGAALIDVQASRGTLPAGAVEELLANDVVLPIRERLLSLDGMEIKVADDHIDPVRAFYRQRKTDHLGIAASRLASLLCVAGLCDSLPADAALPWPTPTKTTQPT